MFPLSKVPNASSLVYPIRKYFCLLYRHVSKPRPDLSSVTTLQLARADRNLIEDRICVRVVRLTHNAWLYYMNSSKELLSQECENSGPFEVASATTPARVSTQTNQAPTPHASQQPANCDELERRLECNHYQECLDISAALNWESFTCAECNGTVNASLRWRAGQNTKRDALARAICGSATISALKSSSLAASCGDAKEKPPATKNKP
jgi:hypothetical protein